VLRSTLIVVISFVLYSRADAGAQENPRFTVVVYNDAGVPAPILQQAKGVTERIYQDAGIRLAWKDHCAPKSGLTQFFVRIVSRSLNLPGEDFGIAFVGPDGRGVQADVFYSGIERLAENNSANPAEIMGHVMAHELGHLLLGMNSHSNIGIMQAHWSGHQFHEMSRGALRFDKRQSQTISARLLLITMPANEGELRGY
jgi:hypothetical protein